jgi:hypothetical protein
MPLKPAERRTSLSTSSAIKFLSSPSVSLIVVSVDALDVEVDSIIIAKAQS